MTKKKAQPTTDSTKTRDTFVNFMSKLGKGANNQHSASTYTFDFITRERIRLEAMYRGAWLIGAAVDFPAEDMTRAGVEFDTTLKPEQISKLQAALTRLRIWQSIADTIRWSRLFGGAVAVMLIDGQKMDTPLNPNSVGKDKFKGLLVLDRWLIQPTFSSFVKELGPSLGLPEFYDVVADSQALPKMRIHHTRLLRMEGVPLPFFQKQAENGWGLSIVERLYDRLTMFDSASVGAGQLAYKAHIRTYSIDKLRELIAAGGKMFDAVVAQVEMIRLMQGNEGLTLLDSTDKFEAHQYTFAGLSDIILQFGQQISGALEIPLVRLFGQSPAGLNSSGESELRTYYDGVNKKQESMLREPLGRLFDVLVRSELGAAPPEGFNYTFCPLWQLTDVEKADIAAKDATSVGGLFDSGLLSAPTALRELKQSSYTTGRFSNITDEEIAEAEKLPPKLELEAEMLQQANAANADNPPNKNKAE